MARRRRYGSAADRQNNTRGMGLPRDVKAGQADPVNRGRLPRRRRRRAYVVRNEQQQA